MRRYLVLIEKGRRNYSAYVPDLPGCVSTGSTLPEVRKNIREAIALHLEGLTEDGVAPPGTSTIGVYVRVDA